MPRTKAAAIMRAAELARNADRRVTAARIALTKAEKARIRAEQIYLTLVRESLLSAEPHASSGQGTMDRNLSGEADNQTHG